MPTDMYQVTWNGTGLSSVAYITGPGVEALRLGSGGDIATEAVAEALQNAYKAGASQPRGEVATIGAAVIKIVRNPDIGRCPIGALLPQHYRDDGSCLCREEGEDDGEGH